MATTAVLRHRRDTAANWTSNNPVMQAGQLGYETDTLKFKFGDGSTSWISLSYASSVSGGSLLDGDKGDIVVSGSGANWTIDTGVVSTSKMGGDVTTAGKALLDDADATAQRVTLGLGSIATQNANAVSITGGTLTDVLVSTGSYSSRTNETLMKRVRKATAGTITKGQVIYITGSTGTHLNVELADASTEAESSPTIAIAAETITEASDSYAIVAGSLTGLSNLPTASFTNGAALWLSTVTGEWTTTRPVAPDHGVFLGWVVNASNGSSGVAYIKIINYNEISELHDVLIVSATANDVLMYDSVTAVWKNRSAGYLSTLITGFATTSHSHAYLPLTGGTITGSLHVSGTVSLSGTLVASRIFRGASEIVSLFASASHAHSTGDITSGIFAPSFLGSGSPSSTNFLRGDGSWAAAGGGVAIAAGTQTGTSGTINFANSNGITFGMSGSNQITASYTVPTQSVQTQASGNIVGAGFSSTTTTGINIVGTNNSLGLSLGVPVYLTTQSVQTQASGNIARTGFTSTSTTGTALVGTLNTGGLSLGIPAYLTTQSVQTQASGNIAGLGFTSTTTTGTAVVGTHNSLGLSLGVPAYLTTQSVQTQASGNIAGSGFTGANATGTLNSNGLSLSIAAPGAANYSIGVSNLGNTAGSTGITGTRIVFVGTNNISLSQSTDANGATISINQTGGGGGGLTNINVSAGTTSNNLSNIIFSNGNGVTFGLNGSTVTASVAAGGGVIESGYSPHGDYPLVVGQIGQGTLALDPDIFPNLTMNMVAMPINFSAATNSTGSFTVSNWIGLYSRNVSTISLAHSTSFTTGITFSGTANSVSFNGWRNLTFPWSTSVSGGRYWIGQIMRTTTGGANCSFSQYLASQVNTNFLGAFGVATNASAQLTLGQGFYSTSTTALPESIAFTQIRGTNSLAQRFPMLAFGFNTV